MLNNRLFKLDCLPQNLMFKTLSSVYLLFTFIFIILLTSLSSAQNPSAESKEIIYVISNSNPSTNISFEDTANNELEFMKLKELIRISNPNVEAVHLNISNISQLSEYIGDSIGLNKIRGLVFLGHGSYEKYYFSKYQSFTGGELGVIISNILINYRASVNQLIYFAGCRMGGDINGKSNFQTNLVRQLSTNKYLDHRNIEVVAHRVETDSTGGSLNPEGFLDRWVLSTGGIGQEFSRLTVILVPLVGGQSVRVMAGVSVTAAFAALYVQPGSIDSIITAGSILGSFFFSLQAIKTMGKQVKSITLGSVAKHGSANQVLRENLTTNSQTCNFLLKTGH